MKSALLDFAQQELGANASMAAPQILEVVETTRHSEPLGGDERMVDNVHSDTTVTRSIKATKRWKETCNLQVERSRVTSQGADVKLAEVAALKSSMENTLREQYAMSAEEEQTFEEHVTRQIIDARVWDGIHFRTADVDGAQLGKEIARYREEHYFHRAWRWHH